MKKYFLSILCVVLGFCLTGISSAQPFPMKFQWHDSLSSARKQAAETGLPIVILFTGSSWCPSCVKLEKEVLCKKEFERAMNGTAIGVKLEFSMKDLDKSQEYRDFRVMGVPSMIVIDAGGRELGRIGYVPGQTPAQYVKFFKKCTPRVLASK